MTHSSSRHAVWFRLIALCVPAVMGTAAGGLTGALASGTDGRRFEAPADSIVATGNPGRVSDPAIVDPDTLRVSGRRSPTRPLRHRPTFATVRELPDASARVRSVADVLQEAAGVRIRRYGGLGALATASIRGSAAGQVEVYLDGLPLNSSQWGVTNLAELPIDNLERIEIYRSGAPAEFAAPGIGGTVNLVTRPTGHPAAVLSVSGGSYDTWKTTFLNSGRLGSFRHLITYRQLQSRGDFRFRYDPGTPVLNQTDDEIRRRENNAFREHDVLLKLDAPPIGGFRFSLQDEWLLKETGLAGHGNLLYADAHADNRRHSLRLGLALPRILDRRLRTEIVGTYLYRRDRYFNPTPAANPGLRWSDVIHRTRAIGLKGTAAVDWQETGQTLKLVAETRHERFAPEDVALGTAGAYDREREVLNLAVEDELSVLTNRALLVVGYRYQEARDNFFGRPVFDRPPPELEDPHWTAFHAPSLGARVSLGHGLIVKGNRTRSSRLPTLYELFGTNGEVKSNPELVPETATTWDGGFGWLMPALGPMRGEIEVSAFHSRRDSLITFIQNAQGNFKAVNLDRAIARGVEISFTARVLDRVRIEGSFTTQDVRHEGAVLHQRDRWVPYVSPRELFVRTELGVGPATLRHEYTFFDRYFQDTANSHDKRVGPRRLHNLGGASEVWARRLTVDLDVQNVFDDQVSDVYGFPMPGRTVYLTLETRLSP